MVLISKDPWVPRSKNDAWHENKNLFINLRGK